MREVVPHRATRQRRGDAAIHSRVVGEEPIRVVPKPLGIHAAELNRKIRGAAVVERIEAIRLAAGGRADLNHLDVRSAQAVDNIRVRVVGDIGRMVSGCPSYQAAARFER